ncbi:MAG: dihydroorotate dehydrogenase [Bacteroidia bacterium]|nr:dihydroorotate dehydrogenase [Bacteroidia bacterium]MDW8346802.1 dihydroorotate dehydrogenase [Bacteroidia bacterium]
MASLSVNFAGVLFQNPIVLASGIMGITGSSLLRVARAGVGGVTTKSIWLTAHEGHKNPVMVGTPHYFINAVGVPDAGIQKAKEEITFYKKHTNVPLIANIIASSEIDYGLITEAISELKPDLIEVNISCPNIEDELGKPLACSRIKAYEVTQICKSKTHIPVIVKMSPNVEDYVGIAQSCQDAGADGLCCFNTFGPGMMIDLESRMPILANKVGGVSGPGIKPLVLKMVNDIYKAVSIPIIGTGGVLTGKDALEMMVCGATLVGVGTMVYYYDIQGFETMYQEMKEWLETHNIQNITEIIGTLQR